MHTTGITRDTVNPDVAKPLSSRFTGITLSGVSGATPAEAGRALRARGSFLKEYRDDIVDDAALTGRLISPLPSSIAACTPGFRLFQFGRILQKIGQ
jgi:hypothetical protein